MCKAPKASAANAVVDSLLTSLELGRDRVGEVTCDVDAGELGDWRIKVPKGNAVSPAGGHGVKFTVVAPDGERLDRLASVKRKLEEMVSVANERPAGAARQAPKQPKQQPQPKPKPRPPRPAVAPAAPSPPSDAEGRRSSGRQKLKPLEFWANERVVYKQSGGSLLVADVLTN